MTDSNYKKLLIPTKFQVIKKTLEIISSGVITPHLEILFFTDLEGIVIPDFLKKLYPNQMLIVLQYQFYNLKVSDTEFSVSLSFSGQPTQITIPFFAISRFYDKISGDILIFDKVAECKKSSSSIISLDQLRDKI
ncbi:MAG: ClpXP protease specificity-enhancing factor SspB [Wolbachia endosymbiont of Tyrophagus putrescentiae]|nr:ClpXP protease specificity-enhancing factor SspB [Wolbachia endosymbiont of Tyrophagus putrescentiae]